MLEAAIAQADSVRAAARQEAAEALREGYAAAHSVRDLADRMAGELADVLRTARREREHLAAEREAVIARLENRQSLTPYGNTEPVVDAEAVDESWRWLGAGAQPEHGPDPGPTTQTEHAPDLQTQPEPGPLEQGEPPADVEKPRDPRRRAVERSVAGIPAPTRFLDLPADERDDSGSSGGTPRQGERACIACQGTGKCGSCGGSGKRWLGVRCRACEGAGECSRCHGRGILGRSFNDG